MNKMILHYFGILSTIIFTVLGQILVKKGVLEAASYLEIKDFKSFFEFLKVSLFDKFVLMGLFSAVLAALSWLFALQKIPLNKAYPFMAISFVLVPYFSMFFFNEIVPLTRWIGISFIVLGIILAAL